ncbi:hypothetical protein F2P56_016430 [Juglans regia]|uniref:Retrotransposon Copia-like N-terminal domain-containing protein n=1 Tax=Juglans regia TaxID=51240 RepID=A0A833XHH6_JUGRE|nr:hypothetical protein F2P56_016430 [Juglans regia]
MAISSDSPPPSSNLSSFSHIISTKLTTDNYLLWKVQISAYLRGQDLFQYIDGSLSSPPKTITDSTTNIPKLNPAFLSWQRTDQLVLSVLFSSLSDSILGHVLSSIMARDLWVRLASMFASHSQAKEFQIRFQLTNLSRGDQPMSEYFGKVRMLADSLAATGNPLPEKEIVTYLLNGLGQAYEPFITSVTTRADPLSSEELYQLLFIHEARTAHFTRTTLSPIEPAANFSASSGKDRGRGRGNGCQGRGRGRFNSNSRGGRTHSFTNPPPHYTAQRPTCQVCNKSGHVALQCRYRFDHSYQLEAPRSFSANYTAPASFSDSSWYPDSAATHHITNDLSNLNISSEQYSGGETIRVGDGNGLPIQNFGQTHEDNPPHRANA